ncbi:hypothetical protein B0H11DRAFT_1959745 [Mycena galericulata]|nr:hypothetical protein B0H11DRAFT_1959745 [Mycena galericulata]
MASSQQTSSSSVPPQSRRTFSERISAVGAKINRALSSEGRVSQNGYDPETESITSTIVEGSDRSSSRRRDPGYHSSGRGGAGNFHSAAPTNSNGDVQEFPWPRGRERAPVPRPSPAAPAVRSTGRGGSGNFSQSPPAADPSYSLRDRELMRAHAEAEKNNFKSSGRGGIGNITQPTPRSRSRSIDPISAPTSMNTVRVNIPGYSPSPTRDRQVNGNGNGPVNGNGTVNGHGSDRYAT